MWKCETWSKLVIAQEGVPCPEGVVEEGEGAVLGHGDQPKRELGHLDRHGVAVYAVQAALGDGARAAMPTSATSSPALVGQSLGTVPSACQALTSRSPR